MSSIEDRIAELEAKAAEQEKRYAASWATVSEALEETLVGAAAGFGLDAALAASQAISLKRIAVALETYGPIREAVAGLEKAVVDVQPTVPATDRAKILIGWITNVAFNMKQGHSGALGWVREFERVYEWGTELEKLLKGP